jgi:hypothetical protein
MVGATVIEMAMAGTTGGSTSVGMGKGVAAIYGSRYYTQGRFYSGLAPEGKDLRPAILDYFDGVYKLQWLGVQTLGVRLPLEMYEGEYKSAWYH